MGRCLINDDSKKAPEGAFEHSVDVRDATLNGSRLFKLTRWRLMSGGINTAISGLAEMSHLSPIEALLALLDALSEGER